MSDNSSYTIIEILKNRTISIKSADQVTDINITSKCLIINNRNNCLFAYSIDKNTNFGATVCSIINRYMRRKKTGVFDEMTGKVLERVFPDMVDSFLLEEAVNKTVFHDKEALIQFLSISEKMEDAGWKIPSISACK